jgi:hypothetical protein
VTDPPTTRRALGRPLQRFRTRAALGLDPSAAPLAFFVPVGALLGPQLLGWLTLDVLAHLDVLVSVALATLGVLVGMALARQTTRVRPVLACASIEASVTMAVVTGAAFALIRAWGLPLDASPLAAALMLGVCASVSSVAAGHGAQLAARQIASNIADLDDVAPILVGAVAVMVFREPGLGHVVRFGLAAGLAGLAIAVAGWLLFEVAHGPAERGVYVIGVLVMLGGSAAYLEASPLFVGLVAGVFWAAAPGRADAIVERDLQKVQHPLIVLLLIVAGASLRVTPIAVWLFVPFVLFRLAGKLAGGWLASRLATDLMPADLGTVLIWPGVVGLAFALNFQQVAPAATGGAVLTAVALGGIASELVALVVAPPPAE